MGLYDNIREEKVGRLSLREPAVVADDALVRDAVETMRRHNLGCAVVINADNVPQGMLTESMVTALLCKSPSNVDDPVVDWMQKDCPTVKLTDPILVVLNALETENSRFLIVVDETDKLSGLTGQKGLMEYVAEHFPQQVIVNRIGCKPYPAEREGA